MLTEAANAPTLAAAATTLCVVLAQTAHTLVKGRKSSSTLHSIETKLDDFTREQRVTNEALRVHITEVDHVVRGVDGENGQRSKINRLEQRVDTIERGRPSAAIEVGAYAPPGGRR